MTEIEKLEFMFIEILNQHEDFSSNIEEHFKRKRNESKFDNIFLKFVDCYHFEISSLTMIEFDSEIKEDSNFYYFGMFESDYLVINKISHRVQLINHYKTLLCECAVDGKSFLYAFLEYFKIPENFYEMSDKEDFNFRVERSKKCSELSGGFNFFTTEYSP